MAVLVWFYFQRLSNFDCELHLYSACIDRRCWFSKLRQCQQATAFQ